MFEGSTLGATMEPGEPAANGHTVWWRWQAPVDGSFSFTPIASEHPVDLGIFAGASADSLRQVANTNAFTTVSGRTYFVRLDAADESTGFLRVRWIGVPRTIPFVSQVGFGLSGRFAMRVEADPRSYYVLYRGTNVTEITEPVNLALGVDGSINLEDPTEQVIVPPFLEHEGADGAEDARLSHNGFYSLRRIPRTSRWTWMAMGWMTCTSFDIPRYSIPCVAMSRHRTRIATV